MHILPFSTAVGVILATAFSACTVTSDTITLQSGATVAVASAVGDRLTLHYVTPCGDTVTILADMTPWSCPDADDPVVLDPDTPITER